MIRRKNFEKVRDHAKEGKGGGVIVLANSSRGGGGRAA